MKIVTTYVVTGRSKDEVLEKATQTWRDFIDDQDALLPSNAVIQFRPDTEVRAMDGSATLVAWSGEVIISQNTNF